MKLVVILVYSVTCWLMPGGVRQRIASSSSSQAPIHIDNSTHVLRGGVTRRIAEAVAPPPPVRESRGGVRKRLLSDEESVKLSELPFNKSLLEDWTNGSMRANKVLKQATNAAAQGARGLEELSNPSSKKHAYRDLRRRVGYPSKAPPVTYLELPSSDGFLHVHPIVCPVNTLEALVQKDEARFKATVLGEDGALSAYWEGMLHKPIYTDVKDHIDTNFSIPASFHGDGAPTTKVEGLVTISWGSTIVTGPTKHVRYVYTVVKKTDFSDGTLEALLDYFAWTGNVLSTGTWPCHDWKGRPHPKAGQPINTKGWRIAFMHAKGDWEFFANDLHMQRWDAADNMCFKCGASNSVPGLLWTNASDAAGWRITKFNHDGFMASLVAQGKGLSPLLNILVLTTYGFGFDTQHCSDLGVAAHVLANVFVEVMPNYGPNQAAQAKGLWNDLKVYEKETTVGSKLQGELTYSRIKTSGDWPKLKAKGGGNTTHGGFRSTAGTTIQFGINS